MMDGFSDRQEFILKERAKGVSNVNIAKQLGVTPPTISKALKDIAKKITAVDSTLDLLKEIGYISNDDTVSLPVTQNTIKNLKQLPMPKTQKIKPKQKNKHTQRSSLNRTIALQSLLAFVRVETIPRDIYSHPHPNYHQNEIPLPGLMIVN